MNIDLGERRFNRGASLFLSTPTLKADSPVQLVLTDT
jgi:hypothetical protein